MQFSLPTKYEQFTNIGAVRRMCGHVYNSDTDNTRTRQHVKDQLSQFDAVIVELRSVINGERFIHMLHETRVATAQTPCQFAIRFPRTEFLHNILQV